MCLYFNACAFLFTYSLRQLFALVEYNKSGYGTWYPTAKGEEKSYGNRPTALVYYSQGWEDNT